MHRKAITYATVLPCIALVAVMVAVYLLIRVQLAAALERHRSDDPLLLHPLVLTQ